MKVEPALPRGLDALRPGAWASPLHAPYIPAHYAERFGTANVERFAGVGHWLPAEAPVDVEDRLQLFLHGTMPAVVELPTF